MCFSLFVVVYDLFLDLLKEAEAQQTLRPSKVVCGHPQYSSETLDRATPMKNGVGGQGNHTINVRTNFLDITSAVSGQDESRR
jgi:hypothetical protein